MTREILFRGKRIDNGEYVYGTPIYPKGYDKVIITTGELAIPNMPNFGFAQYEVIPETVGMWTGLTDKNGKKIFEGDKVVGDVGNGYNRVSRLLQRIGIVQYGNKSPGFTLKIINRFGVNENGESDFCDFQGCGVSFGAFGNMEVIGTIFDKEESND